MIKNVISDYQMVGRKKNESFQNLKDQIKKMVDSWSIRYLS